MLSIQFGHNESALSIAVECGSLEPRAFLPCELLVFIPHAVSNLLVDGESLILRGFVHRCNRGIALLSQEGSVIATRSREGLVPHGKRFGTHSWKFLLWEPPRRFAPRLVTQEGNLGAPIGWRDFPEPVASMNLRRGFVCEAFPGSVWGFALLRRKFGIEFKRHLVLEKPFLNLNPLKDTPVHGAHFQSTPCEFDFDRSHVPP